VGQGLVCLLAFVLLNRYRLKARVQRESLAAMEQIKTLQGLLPICAHCKKIRDDQGYWHQVEAYVGRHSDVEFSHGMCPDGVTRLYPGFRQGRQKRPSSDVPSSRTEAALAQRLGHLRAICSTSRT